MTKSKELNALKPLEFIDDDEIFMVLDPVSQERLFISVLGGAGQEFGLAVYIGEEGLKSLQLVRRKQSGDGSKTERSFSSSEPYLGAFETLIE